MTAPRPRVQSRRDRKLVRDIEKGLEALAYEAPASSALVPEWFASKLKELLRCDRTIAYRPACSTDGVWGLGETSSTDATLFASYDAQLRAAAQGSVQPFQYEPLRPSETQRNRVCTLADIHTHGPDTTCIIEEIWPRVGLGGHDQLRVLVCDGPALLGWIGGFREEPFTPRERRAFASLVVPLQRTLALRRRLAEGGLARAGLANALEAVGAPSFVAYRNGRVEHTNTVGAWLLERNRSETHARLKTAIAGGDSACLVSKLEGPGIPECFLVVLQESGTLLETRLRIAMNAWSVSAREIEVLRWLVSGDANKEIAAKIGCSEVSVERRVTKLLRKAKCDGRSRLIAAFWAAE